MSQLSPPISERDHVLGGATAPITLTQYGDYECPLSHDVYRLIETLREAMGPSLRYAYRHFPLNKIHPHAESAARAAEAAAAQERFWEMHHLLFENHRNLKANDLQGYAVRLGLDVERFTMDAASDEAAARIRQDLRYGLQSEVDTTLNLFINGQRYQGEMKIKEIGAVIEQLTPASS